LVAAARSVDRMSGLFGRTLGLQRIDFGLRRVAEAGIETGKTAQSGDHRQANGNQGRHRTAAKPERE